MLLPLNRTLCAAGLPLRNHVVDVADVDDVANVIERRRGVVRAHVAHVLPDGHLRRLNEVLKKILK